MVKASEVFPGPDPDGKVKEVKNWLKSKGVRDFEPVSLFCDQLTKVRSNFEYLSVMYLSFFARKLWQR